jgi:uncharacterized protein with NAD-binding domain and iron-sulfur cluster
MPDRLIEDHALTIAKEARALGEPGGLVGSFARMAELAGFDGDEVAAGLKAGFEASGTIDARVVVRTIDASHARSLLPRGLELAPQPITPRGRHPVVLIFGEDTFDAWFGRMEYREVLIAIPFVQRADTHVPHRGPFCYMPRLLLDSRAPRLLGNLLYGYEKAPARIESDDARFVVHGPEGALLATLSSSEAGDPVHPSAAADALADVRRLLEQPTISQVARIYDSRAFHRDSTESAFLASNIRYLFDDPSASVQPIRAEVEITRALSPRGLPTDRFAVGSLFEAELGAFRLKAPVRISLPGSCADVEYPRSRPAKKTRVVVLGGGPAACAAAFHLAKQRDRYDVSLYTMGWRLGGKCAAGRPAEGPERIEEHGLHAFLGFYENAFRTVREVWATAGHEIAREHEGPIAAAFAGKLDVGLMDRFAGVARYFPTGQRVAEGEPGLVPTREGDRLPGFGEVVLSVFGRIELEVRELVQRPAALPGDLTERLAARLRDAESDTLVQRFLRVIDRALGVDTDSVAGALARLVDHLREVAIEELAEGIERGAPLFRGASWLLQIVRDVLRRDPDKDGGDPDDWFRWSNLDVVLTIAIGILDSRVVHLDSLDEHDFREWLLAHGMDPRNRDIATVRMVYDTMFATADDEPVRADRLACGVGLRWFLLTGFGFRGYPGYDFRYSCPQTLFTPYHQALERLGVKIHYFHRTTELAIDGDASARRLSAIRLRRQATVIAGAHAYAPFAEPRTRRDPPGLPDWPAAPRWDLLAEGERLRAAGVDLEDPTADGGGVADLELRLGEDFDECVLGVPLGALPPVVRALTDPASPVHDPAWARLVSGTSLVRTASFQLWFRRPAAALYSGPRRDLLTGYAYPWPSMADFTHLVALEGWPEGSAPSFLAYHTGALPAGRGDAENRHEVGVAWRRRMKAWLREHHRGFYDRVESWDDWLDALVAPDGAQGEARLDAQYFTVADRPSDLYVLSRPGEMRHRLGAADSGVRHLVLCGDWTRTDLGCGCVEAATQSGMLAARVLSDFPRYVWHPGF